jgi:excisionase family DNA binding protein|nr:MAG TPA: helix-turn-helix domain protein [Caudoviricetes sp.]
MKEQLDRIEKLVRVGAKEVLNVEEAALMLRVSKSRVYHLVSSREIPHYKNGKNVLFKKSEIEEWLLRDRIPTNNEIDSKAATYVATHKK